MTVLKLPKKVLNPEHHNILDRIRVRRGSLTLGDAEFNRKQRLYKQVDTLLVEAAGYPVNRGRISEVANEIWVEGVEETDAILVKLGL
ncbi:hypothetical protein DF3PA_70113 [Candidatus Defluviicoccus seviourii]|uniref:Uncharacterized protein n=1 Tax=Candidatus Defluviicoccus seviourii TaxID=2565273 RepID=A0A564WH77_9PROT|nr:hypothetical protein DF3PA_70113 [Candidatus Defluviicoccus seviourii]